MVMAVLALSIKRKLSLPGISTLVQNRLILKHALYLLYYTQLTFVFQSIKGSTFIFQFEVDCHWMTTPNPQI